jgi:hypothetical protein
MRRAEPRTWSEHRWCPARGSDRFRPGRRSGSDPCRRRSGGSRLRKVPGSWPQNRERRSRGRCLREKCSWLRWCERSGRWAGSRRRCSAGTRSWNRSSLLRGSARPAIRTCAGWSGCRSGRAGSTRRFQATGMSEGRRSSHGPGTGRCGTGTAGASQRGMRHPWRSGSSRHPWAADTGRLSSERRRPGKRRPGRSIQPGFGGHSVLMAGSRPHSAPGPLRERTQGRREPRNRRSGDGPCETQCSSSYSS